MSDVDNPGWAATFDCPALSSSDLVDDARWWKPVQQCAAGGNVLRQSRAGKAAASSPRRLYPAALRIPITFARADLGHWS